MTDIYGAAHIDTIHHLNAPQWTERSEILRLCPNTTHPETSGFYCQDHDCKPSDNHHPTGTVCIEKTWEYFPEFVLAKHIRVVISNHMPKRSHVKAELIFIGPDEAWGDDKDAMIGLPMDEELTINHCTVSIVPELGRWLHKYGDQDNPIIYMWIERATHYPNKNEALHEQLDDQSKALKEAITQIASLTQRIKTLNLQSLRGVSK